MADGLSLPVAFMAGLFSFFSPCVLPLIPAYVVYLTGNALPSDGENVTIQQRRRMAWQGLMFVIGFSLVFVALGASAGGLGLLLRDYLPLLRRLGGVVVLLFGLHMAGLLRLFILDGERRIQPPPPDGSLWRAVALGATFSAGWTPCIGPVLASVLVLAGSSASLEQGVWMLAAYAAGMALPFMALTLSLHRMSGLLRRLLPHAPRIRTVGGVLLSVLGLMIYTDTFTWLNSVFNWSF